MAERERGQPIERPKISSKPPELPRSKPIPPPGYRSAPTPAQNPRRVRGGQRLKRKDGETAASWITQRLERVAEQGASGEAWREGMEYARLGQTRRFEIDPGVIVASVQGRMPRAYTTRLEVDVFDAQQRDRIIGSMVEQSRFAAKILAGELPTNIDDLFAPLGLRFMPVEPGDISPRCTCKEQDKPWCKHAVCALILAADHFGRHPLELFRWRGLPEGELSERLRELRALSGQGPGAAPVYEPFVAGVSDAEVSPLDASSADFWEAGHELRSVDLPIDRPTTTHVLLRRLGPSPFPEARFPLVGLLATCYELIGEDAAAGVDDGGPDDEGPESLAGSA